MFGRPTNLRRDKGASYHASICGAGCLGSRSTAEAAAIA